MRTLLVALTLLGIAAVPASATDFCVAGPAGCAGTNFDATQLQDAFAAANTATGAPHRVVIAAGTYTGPFNVSVPTGVALEVVGAGTGQTILTNGTGGVGSTALFASGALIVVKDITFQQLGQNGYALRLGDAQGVGIAADSTGPANSGVELSGSAVLRNSTVTVATGRGVFSTAPTGLVEDTTITASGGTGIGAQHSGAGSTTTVRRSRITGFLTGAGTDSGTMRLEDSIIDLQARDGAIGVAAVNGNNSNDLQRVEVIRTTIVGTAAQVGLRAIANGTGTEQADLVAVDSVVSLTNAGSVFHQCVSQAAPTTTATMTLTNVAGRPANSSALDCTPVESGVIDLTATGAGFVDEAGGDLRPRFDSPLVDSGSPVPGPQALDFLSNPRFVGANVDRGAIEYQRSAPQFTSASGTPTPVAAGAPVAFSATATDADTETVSFSWDFGDGQSAPGPAPSHAYSSGGTFTATVTATDESGATSTASVSVTVVAPPQATTPPVIVTDGSPTYRETVTLTPATWSAAGTPLREWLSCDRAGANCVVIAGASATSFTLGATVVGRTLRVRETLTNLGGPTTSTSAATKTITRRPFVVRRARVIGVVRRGRVVRCGAVSFGGFPTPALTYRWLRNGRPIANATRKTYAIRRIDVGARISCRVTARNSAGLVKSTSLRVLVRP